MSWGWALVGGLAGAALSVGLSVRKTESDLRKRALLFENVLATGGSSLELALAYEGEQLQADLRVYAEGLAEETANEHLRTRYSLGPAQMAQADRLSRSFSRG